MANLLLATRESDSLGSENPGMSQPSRGLVYRVAEKTLEPVPETTFASEKLLESRDLQRLLKSDISVIAPGLMVIAEEFGQSEDSGRRIDLLCLDQQQ